MILSSFGVAGSVVAIAITPAAVAVPTAMLLKPPEVPETLKEPPAKLKPEGHFKVIAFGTDANGLGWVKYRGEFTMPKGAETIDFDWPRLHPMPGMIRMWQECGIYNVDGSWTLRVDIHDKKIPPWIEAASARVSARAKVALFTE